VYKNTKKQSKLKRFHSLMTKNLEKSFFGMFSKKLLRKFDENKKDEKTFCLGLRPASSLS